MCPLLKIAPYTPSNRGGSRWRKLGRSTSSSFAPSAVSMALSVQGRRYDDLQWAREMGAYPIKTGS